MSVSKGLENVIIKATRLTYIDGERGILRYGGYDIEDLVNNSSFEEVAYLMLYGKLPNSLELRKVKERIQDFEIPENVIHILEELPKDADAIAMMETAFSSLSSFYNAYWIGPRERALEVIGKAATIVANIYRIKEGMPTRIPEPSESYAKSFLKAIFSDVSDMEIKAMNASLILYADHEVPASTTADLIVASTLSDMYSCVAAALSALKGPLHGGAAEEAFKQFVEIGDPSNVEAWFNKVIAEKKRLMGFGHRVYKTYDPRSRIFKKLAKELKSERGGKYLEIAEKLEEVGTRHFAEKKIFPNTDFYSGIVFYSIGFPIYMFTPLFALSRTLGWLAHAIEYVEDDYGMIRPRALYVGSEKRSF
ncbi:citrate synthase [Candidatus Acidianus copahuensis]|uniref:Citrate synthase n=1 Tax=Candidatus Acidianus copahuensis TaxID=1160895 RepID=A0A031LMC9_9CREN|nr:citrate synthase [Candidatus Acidianus copahuensis]EZQ02058.1 citrate synthase [Candidatus Acidianus copahuensis]NON63212.1 citrate synthase [Acidianus sp. RZ1]